MARLNRGLKGFYDLMRSHTAGQHLTREDVMAATGWSAASFTTYLRKNKLASFLEELPDRRLRVLKHGPALSEADVQGSLSQVTPQGMTLLRGEQLIAGANVYALVKQLGQGAVGHVWEVTKEGSADRFAVKIVNPRVDLLEPSVFDEIRTRFEREAHHGLKLRHEAIIPYVDRGKHRGAPFLVMELAHQSVADLLAAGPLSIEDSTVVVSRCVSALTYLHSQHCIHRDVKPANILRASHGFVLGDLGIAKWSDLNASFTDAATLTRGSVQLGSWFYMAPEQQSAPNEAVPASDIYALGVTWYELLTAKVPPAPAVFAARRTSPPCSDSSIHQLIQRMTEFDAPARPTLGEIGEFLAKKAPRSRRKS